jgi:hypothetical protein
LLSKIDRAPAGMERHSPRLSFTLLWTGYIVRSPTMLAKFGLVCSVRNRLAILDTPLSSSSESSMVRYIRSCPISTKPLETRQTLFVIAHPDGPRCLSESHSDISWYSTLMDRLAARRRLPRSSEVLYWMCFSCSNACSAAGGVGECVIVVSWGI